VCHVIDSSKSVEGCFAITLSKLSPLCVVVVSEPVGVLIGIDVGIGAVAFFLTTGIRARG